MEMIYFGEEVFILQNWQDIPTMDTSTSLRVMQIVCDQFYFAISSAIKALIADRRPVAILVACVCSVVPGTSQRS
jgi:hypothetical protein